MNSSIPTQTPVNSEIKKINNLFKWLTLTIVIGFLFLGAIIYTLFYQSSTYYPGQKIAGINLEQLNPSSASKILEQNLSDFLISGITYSYNGQTFQLFNNQNSDPDFLPLVEYDLETSLGQITSFNNNLNWFDKLLYVAQLKSWPEFKLYYNLNDEAFSKQLKNKLASYEQLAQNAHLEIGQNQSPIIIPEQNGKIINYPKITDETKQSLSRLSLKAIAIDTEDQRALITAQDLDQNWQNQALDFLKNAQEIKLNFNDQTWLLKKEIYQDWLTRDNENKNNLGFETNLIQSWLEKNLSPEINQLPKEAKFSVANGRVNEFQESQSGQKLLIPETSQEINTQVFENNVFEVALKTEIIPAAFSGPAENDLGISELLGIGKSNFSGSPKNRRANIANGARAINGLLIKPDETFSLIKALGKIDQSTGYLPELVIKGDKTTPEFGGGLCQIGTTVFRATTASGLPIIERRNHSYRVRYYEPAGTDATIYDPQPDYKFKNDTGSNILIQAKIKKDDLFVEFWGTKDGRIASTTKPTIYNIVKPPATIIIPSTELKPGEKKCTEVAHSGADAYFDYSVIYPSGEKKDTRFKSHYIPWPEKCLVGVTATSTGSVISTGSGNSPTNTPTTTQP